MTTTTATPTAGPHSAPDISAMSPIARWGRAFQALAKVVADPEKTDQVLVFATYANAGAVQRRRSEFIDDPQLQRLFTERRTIDSHSIDLAALGALPHGTLGRAYADFLRERGLTPDVFERPPEEHRDPAVAYAILRVRQTHDLWHVVTGYTTDTANEVALQAFTYAQLGTPASAVLAVIGVLRGLPSRPGLPLDVARAFRLGRHSRGLAAFPWEDHWSTPLAEVRAILGLPTVPRPPTPSAS